MVIETPPIPNDMVDLMKALAKQVIKEKPENIYEFSARFFEDLLVKRDGSLDKGYGKFRRYEKYCAVMEKMDKRPMPKSIDPKTCTNYDSTDSGISSGGDVGGHHGSSSSGGEDPPIEVNGVAMKAISRKQTSKTVRKPRNVSINSNVANSLLAADAMVSGDNSSTQQQEQHHQPRPTSKVVRKLSSKRPQENLIVIAEETSSDVAESEEVNRQNVAAVRIQRAIRRCVSKMQEKKEHRAAGIIQKAYKMFVAKKISNFEVDGLKPLAEHFVEVTQVGENQEIIQLTENILDINQTLFTAKTNAETSDLKIKPDEPVLNEDVLISHENRVASGGIEDNLTMIKINDESDYYEQVKYNNDTMNINIDQQDPINISEITDKPNIIDTKMYSNKDINITEIFDLEDIEINSSPSKDTATNEKPTNSKHNITKNSEDKKAIELESYADQTVSIEHLEENQSANIEPIESELTKSSEYVNENSANIEQIKVTSDEITNTLSKIITNQDIKELTDNYEEDVLPKNVMGIDKQISSPIDEISIIKTSESTKEDSIILVRIDNDSKQVDSEDIPDKPASHSDLPEIKSAPEVLQLDLSTHGKEVLSETLSRQVPSTNTSTKGNAIIKLPTNIIIKNNEETTVVESPDTNTKQLTLILDSAQVSQTLAEQIIDENNECNVQALQSKISSPVNKSDSPDLDIISNDCTPDEKATTLEEASNLILNVPKPGEGKEDEIQKQIQSVEDVEIQSDVSEAIVKPEFANLIGKSEETLLANIIEPQTKLITTISELGLNLNESLKNEETVQVKIEEVPISIEIGSIAGTPVEISQQITEIKLKSNEFVADKDINEETPVEDEDLLPESIANNIHQSLLADKTNNESMPTDTDFSRISNSSSLNTEIPNEIMDSNRIENITELEIQTIPNDSYLELSEQSPRESENDSERTANEIGPSLDDDLMDSPKSCNSNATIDGDGDGNHDTPGNVNANVMYSTINSSDSTSENSTLEDAKMLSSDLETQPSLKKSPTVLKDLSILNIPSLNNSPTFDKETADDLIYLSVDNNIPETPFSGLPSPSSASQSSSAPTSESELLSDITVIESSDNITLDNDSLSNLDMDNKSDLVSMNPEKNNSSQKTIHHNDDNIETNNSDTDDQDPIENQQLSTAEVKEPTSGENNALIIVSSEKYEIPSENEPNEKHEEKMNKLENEQKETKAHVDEAGSPHLEPSSPVKEPIANNSIGHIDTQHDKMVFPSPCINRITEDEESDNTSSEENYPITVNQRPLVPYEHLLSSDLSETDDVQIERCGDGESCVDETSRDELDELSEVENVDLTSFGEDSLEAMYYRIRKDEILLDKSRKQLSAGKTVMETTKNTYEDHGISEQPTEASNLEDESSKENKERDNLYDQHGISEQLTTEVSSNPEEEDNNIERSPNPVDFAIQKQKILIQKLHDSSVNYEDVVTPLEDQEEDDQYPDSLDIRRKMWASSVSETDSDYVDTSTHRLVKDDFNISTALDHMSSSESGSTIVSAATKIQAGARGFLTRRRIRRSIGGTSAASVDQTCSFGNAAINKSLEDLIEQQELLTMDEAVVKLQRFYRMYRQRKTAADKQKRLILAHECDDSQCPGSAEDDKILGQFQEHDLADVIDVRVEQKKTSQTPLENSASSSSHLQLADKEIVDQSGEFDQRQPATNDVFEPAKIASSDAQRVWSPNNQHMSIALSSAADDSLEMDSLHHQRRRLTLQRGDAVQRYSSPDESSPQPIQTSVVAKTLLPNTVVDTPTTTTSHALSSSQKKSQRKLLGVRQNSMPVQIDSDLIRIIPKHLRKRIKSAESVSARKDSSSLQKTNQ